MRIIRSEFGGYQERTEQYGFAELLRDLPEEAFAAARQWSGSGVAYFGVSSRGQLIGWTPSNDGSPSALWYLYENGTWVQTPIGSW